jgi:hypothetical protein
MEGTPDVDGYHQTRRHWAFSPEWPFLDWRLPTPPAAGSTREHRRLRPGRPGRRPQPRLRAPRLAVGPTAREFFEWDVGRPADGTPEWVSYTVDNPYPVYPVWPERPLLLPPPYPKMSDPSRGRTTPPSRTFRMKATLAAGVEPLCAGVAGRAVAARFSTDTYRIPYPGLTPKWGLRPYLTISYSYDPETIDHTTGKIVG